MDEMKKLLGVRIKLDIANAIRNHPHLDGDAASHAYATLANDSTVSELLRDLAREEIQSALARGDVPGAATLLLAGYKPNRIDLA